MVKQLTKLNTKSITAILEDWFIDMGKPVRLRSDGGPQFRSEFEDWAKKENITHELSSPYHHQSNGHAEVTVREMKHLLTKMERNWQKFRLALREYRNTPRFDGLSPSQWLTGYRQRTDAPAAPSAYERITDEQLKSHLDLRGKEQARIKDQSWSKREKETKTYAPGSLCWVQDPKTKRWSIKATIVKARNKRSFIVNDGFREFMRNRRFLRPRSNTETEVSLSVRG